MRIYAILVALMLVASAGLAVAWGPNDPTDAKADPDGDKLGNLDEFKAGSNPLNPDTDGGGCWDGWEVMYGLDPANPLDDAFDSDNDGWSNIREFLEGTNPMNPNTDSDSFPLDSTDPHPLIPDGDWIDAPGGIAGGSGGSGSEFPGQGSGSGSGSGNGMGQGQGQGQGSGQGQGQGNGQALPTGFAAGRQDGHGGPKAPLNSFFSIV
jgi:hypothetical protein